MAKVTTERLRVGEASMAGSQPSLPTGAMPPSRRASPHGVPSTDLGPEQPGGAHSPSNSGALDVGDEAVVRVGGLRQTAARVLQALHEAFGLACASELACASLARLARHIPAVCACVARGCGGRLGCDLLRPQRYELREKPECMLSFLTRMCQRRSKTCRALPGPSVVRTATTVCCV